MMNTRPKRRSSTWTPLTVTAALVALSVACGMTSSPPPTVAPAITAEATPQAAATEPLEASTTRVLGFGVLGDSSSDEYRADDNRGADYPVLPLNWIELLVTLRGLNFGPVGTWGEPRRSGYEYNWARSGMTAHEMISSGAADGLAEQVRSGKVSHVVIWIGGNDFGTWNGNYVAIYSGQIAGAALQAKIDGILGDITAAVDKLQQAGDVKIVIVTLPDRGVAPDTIGSHPEPDKRQRVTDAVNAVNDGIRRLADERGMAIVDGAEITRQLAERIDAGGTFDLDGVKIDVFNKGADPHFGRLDDSDGHPGTAMSGLIANWVFIESFDQAYGLGVEPFSADEILKAAGLR